MKEELYNILIEQDVLTHGIGKVDDLQLPQTLWKFNNIIKQNGLYSKESLKKLGFNVTGKFSGNIRMTKENFISLFDPTIYSLRDKLLSSKIKQYPLDLNEITFLVDKKVEEDLPSERNYFDYTEVKIENHVPSIYFSGIIIPTKKGLFEEVDKILLKHNMELPVYDSTGKLLNGVPFNRII